MSAEADRVDKQIRGTEKQIDAFIATLDGFLGREIRRVLRKLKDDPDAVIENIGVLATLEQAMRDAGLGERLNGLSGVYDEQLAQIRDEYARLGVENVFGAVDTKVVEAMVVSDFSVVGKQVERHVGSLRSELIRSIVTGGKPFADIIAEKTDEFSGRLQSNLNTEINTAVSGFHRTVTITKADELGIDKFIYLGPQDQITREFCKPKIGKAFTRDEIQRLNNRQGLDPFVYAGGYNCRHQWRPISDERFESLRNGS